jgi:exosortase
VLNAGKQESVWSPPLLLFVSLIAISLAVWWTPVRSTFSLALNDEQYTHILLILPISAVLIYLDWKPQDVSVSPNSLRASVMAVALLLRTVLARFISTPPDIQLFLEMLAFVLWSSAAFWLCFGDRAFSRAMFPLFFLLWLVPLPNFAVNAIVSLLQQGSAAAAHLIFLAARVPVEQRGLFLRIPGFILEVAPECSSIRSSMILIVTAMALAYLLLRSQWRRILLVVIALPLSVAKNGLRIFVLGFLAVRVDPSFLTGRLHHQGGAIYLLIALAVILVLIWILRKGETRRSEIQKAVII